MMFKVLRNERGATVFYTIWLFAITAILLILIANIIKIYTVKEAASTSAEQASLAATNVVYNATIAAVYNYDKTVDGEIHGILDGKIGKKIKKKKIDIKNAHPGYSDSRTKREAIDEVLSDEIPKHPKLKNEINNKLTDSETVNDLESAVQDMVDKNHGKTSKTKIYYFNDKDQIEVKSAANYDKIKYDRFFTGGSEDVIQKGTGPEVGFISKLGWRNQLYTPGQ